MDLIDKKSLMGDNGLFALRGCCGNCSCCRLHTDDGCGVIIDAPIIDAVPVVHGHWKWCENGEIRCSKCFDLSGVASTKDNFKECIETLNYCSNCGAKMGEEV